MSERFRKSFAITKFDEATRRIEGIATAEILDAHGEVVDYETAKAVIAATWPGNFREMHKAEAVGNGSVLSFDDATKTITVGGIVSEGAPNTWAKVKDGTLKMFSIGGRAKERRTEKLGDKIVKRLFLESIDEISLVDNGACPGALFAIAKAVDGTLTPLDADTEVDKGAAGNPKPYQVTQAAALVAALNELLADLVWDANYAEQDGATAVEPAKMQEIQLVKSAVESLLQFLSSRFAGQFPDGTADAPAVDVVVETAEVANVRLGTLAKSALALIHVNVEKAGARHSKKDQDMVQGVHDQAVALGGVCAKEEADTAATDDETAKLATAIKASGIAAVDIVALQVLDRAGKPIGERIVVRPGDIIDPAAPAAKAADAPVTKVETLPDVQKLMDEIHAEREVNKATMTAQAATITDLTGKLDLVTKRLETVEKQPAAGGPAVRVAEKQVLANGEQPAASGALTPEALAEVIKQLPDGPAKDTLLMKLHSMNVAAGIGVTVIGGVSPQR